MLAPKAPAAGLLSWRPGSEEDTCHPRDVTRFSFTIGISVASTRVVVSRRFDWLTANDRGLVLQVARLDPRRAR